MMMQTLKPWTKKPLGCFIGGDHFTLRVCLFMTIWGVSPSKTMVYESRVDITLIGAGITICDGKLSHVT